MSWIFLEHAKERLAERYKISETSRIEKICRMLDNEEYELIGDITNSHDRQLIQIDYGMKIQLVTIPKVKQVITVLPNTFEKTANNIKALQKQLKKFMSEEINVAAYLAREVNARMKRQENRTDVVMKHLHNLVLNSPMVSKETCLYHCTPSFEVITECGNFLEVDKNTLNTEKEKYCRFCGRKVRLCWRHEGE